MTSNDIAELDQLGRCESQGDVTNIATVYALSSDSGNNLSGSDSAVVVCEEASGGTQGCTPGYWKQRHHFFAWTNPPYAQDTGFGLVFSECALVPELAGESLLDALKQGGGGFKALGRHAVAALLNAASADVDYPRDTQAVISAVNEACRNGDPEALKDNLDYENNLGCPLRRER